MDPVSAFSLACGVIQVVDFSTRVIANSRELYKNGSLAGNEEIERMALRLESLRTNLELPTSNSDQKLHIDDKNLLQLAEECSDLAKDVIKIVGTLKLDGSYSMRQALKKSFKALWKKGDVNRFQERLDRYQKVLDTKILINLRKRIDLAAVRQTEEFRNLDGNYQSILIGLATEQRSFRELRDMIQAGTTSTKDHVTHLFQHQRKDLEIQEHRQRILKSLWFEDIHARHETIHEAHKSTFQWIFQDSTGQSRAGHDFVQWLERGGGTYWISGKAGSGKSTLMRYIYEHPQLNMHLKIWSASKPILSPTFFFWRAGSALQQTSAGLLRSLLYQIHQTYPGLIMSTAQTESCSGVVDSSSQQSRLIPVWTETRLQREFQNTLSTIAKSHHVCFFIDGLDEISANQDDLITLIERIIQNVNIKVCLSSRPYRVFEDAFGSTMKLRLQDLTEKDLQIYVSDKVYAIDQAQLLASKQPWRFSDHVSSLVENAQGVFLWVELAVKDQIEGLKNGDSLEQLQDRLRLLPTEIEDLYVNMLDRIDRIYRREAAQSFEYMMKKHSVGWAFGGVSLLDMALAVFDGLDDLVLSSSSAVNLREILDLCNTRRKKIPITCAGLLEVQGRRYRRAGVDDVGLNMRRRSSDSSSEDTDGISSPDLVGPSPLKETSHEFLEVASNENEIHVGFVHRTVLDFLQEHPRAKDFMIKHCPSDTNGYVIIVKAFLAEVRIAGFPNTDDLELPLTRPTDVDGIMLTILEVESLTGTAQVDLCNLVDHSMTRLDLENAQGPQDGHWTRRYSRIAMFQAPRRLTEPTRSTSQSSSATNRSFYATMSASANTDASVMVSEQAVDFLGFAAESGLILYVQEVLESHPEWLDSPTATYLLRCVLSFMYLNQPDYLYAHVPEVIATLVRQGGKPNVSMFSKTAWIIFLQKKCFTLTYRRSIKRKERSCDLEKALVIAARVFLEHGADVHEIIDIEDWLFMKKMLQPGIWDTKSGALPDRVYVNLQLSAFSILELCFEGEPGWPQIREVCDAKGAQTYSKCTSLLFRHVGEDYYERSQERLNDFFERYVQCRKAVRTTNLANIVSELRRLVIRYYEDAREKSIDGQNPSPDSDSDSDLDDYESCNEASLKNGHDDLEFW